MTEHFQNKIERKEVLEENGKLVLFMLTQLKRNKAFPLERFYTALANEVYTQVVDVLTDEEDRLINELIDNEPDDYDYLFNLLQKIFGFSNDVVLLKPSYKEEDYRSFVSIVAAFERKDFNGILHVLNKYLDKETESLNHDNSKHNPWKEHLLGLIDIIKKTETDDMRAVHVKFIRKLRTAFKSKGIPMGKLEFSNQQTITDIHSRLKEQEIGSVIEDQKEEVASEVTSFLHPVLQKIIDKKGI